MTARVAERVKVLTPLGSIVNRRSGCSRGTISRLKIGRASPATSIMHKDWRLTCEYIVRVELRDGEVVAIGRARGRAEGENLDVGVGVRVQGVADREAAGRDPGVGGVVPEGMIRRRMEGGGLANGAPDGDVEKVVVVVDPLVLDFAAADVLAGRWIGGFDHVAGFDIDDGLTVGRARTTR